jgi:serine protease AprX
LHHEWLTPFPVYSPNEQRLLPLPLRVHSHPQFTGRGITVAMLDSGFFPHPDLTRYKTRSVHYIDATDSEPIEQPFFKQTKVENWHGQMTSCVAFGSGAMSEGLYRGIAPQANLVLVKTGSPRIRRIHDGDIQRALSWVLAQQQRYHIRVVNISLGGDHASNSHLTPLDALVEEATRRGMVVVAAAGNGGRESVFAPASAPSAITVGGLNDQNTLNRRLHQLYHSNYGRGGYGAPKPELIAPALWLAAPMLPHTETHLEGMFLWRLLNADDKKFARLLESPYARELFKASTRRLPIDEIRRKIRARMMEQKFIHPHYQHVDGTSFAAPIVAAIAAQMLEANPTLLPEQVKQMLVTTAEPLSNAPVERQGGGVVNGAQAVAAALRAPHGALTGLPLSPYVTPWATTFYYFNEQAKEVALVGRFNAWQPRGYALQIHRRGIWQITIPRLPRGDYPYKFLVDQAHWVSDPENVNASEDGFGGFNSILRIN